MKDRKTIYIFLTEEKLYILFGRSLEQQKR